MTVESVSQTQGVCQKAGWCGYLSEFIRKVYTGSQPRLGTIQRQWYYERAHRLETLQGVEGFTGLVVEEGYR